MRPTALPTLLFAVTLLAAGILAFPEPAFAPCNTPGPAIPRTGGGTPGTPTPGTPSPGTPPSGTPSSGTPSSGGPTTPGGRRSGAASGFPGYAGSWRIWWDLNREFLLGLRGVTKIVASGGEADSAVDPMAPYRARVREALQAVALSGANEEIRGAALCALGRAGDPDDAELFLRILRTPQQPSKVVQGAAIGLASLPRLRTDEDRKAVRDVLDAILADRLRMSGRTRLLSVMALGLRGRCDPALVRALGARLERPGLDADEAASVLFASGLTRMDLSAPMLVRVTDSGELGHRSLHDVARSYGVLALALAGGPNAAPTIYRLLEGKHTQVHSRRSAALAIGHLLREGAVDEEVRASLETALSRRMFADPDPLVQGWCAIAYGSAKSPYPPEPLEKLLESGSGTARPYAALALGLTARNLPEKEAGELRSFLIDAYRKAKGFEVPGALAIALGLAGAREGREILSAHVRDRRVSDNERAPACQALGLLGGDDPDCRKSLLLALNSSSDDVTQNAALGLGILGGPDAGLLLVKLLSITRSERVQAHMVAGLSHVGGTDVVAPLLTLLRDPTRKRDVRVSAATALGFIVAPREHDLLFELDAYTNPYGLTEAGRDLVLYF